MLEANQTSLALFDFDGTITTKDSLVDFIQYAVGKPAYWLGLLKLSPMLSAYTLKLIPNHIAKEKLIAYFFKGWNDVDFQKIADQYSLGMIDKIVRPAALQKITWHQTQGHKVVVVSASMENWLKKWCEQHDLELIATRLEIQTHKLTGQFATKNCYGIEKVNRIKEQHNLSNYRFIYAYGDSRGDKEMLDIAHQKFYKNFKSTSKQHIQISL